MKSAVGISSLISGFTIWSSNGCDCLLSRIAVISEMSLSGSSTSALASSSGRSKKIEISIFPPSFSALVGFLDVGWKRLGLLFLMTS